MKCAPKFLIGLTHREEGDLGPVYGFQWRHFGAEYVDMHTDYSHKGVDQLAYVIDRIKNKPECRRIIMSAWNPVGKINLLFTFYIFPNLHQRVIFFSMFLIVLGSVKSRIIV